MAEEQQGGSGRALLLVAHGSRRAESNREVVDLSAALASRAALGYDRVSHAFLELAEPALEHAIDELVDGGARHITLVPYFLACGRHVAEDIPRVVSAKLARYPGLELEVTGHLGAAEGMVELVSTLAAR